MITDIDGIALGNPVSQNSYQGSVFTDEGPWSDGTAMELQKDHGLCSKHFSNDIFTSQCSLGGLIPHYTKDMNKLIYEPASSDAALNGQILQAMSKYGADSSAKKFITRISEKRRKICATHTQYIFSWGGTTTQRGEGWNDRFKGHGALKVYLANANLITGIKLIDRLAREQDRKSITMLASLRRQGKRWSDYYQHLSQDLQYAPASTARMLDCAVPSVGSFYMSALSCLYQLCNLV